jgi:hypothetical protein
MPIVDDFDGSFGSGILMSVTDDTTSVVINIFGIEEVTPPGRSYKEDKYTPISGARAGFEQAVLCSQEASSCGLTLTYNKGVQVALDEVCGKGGKTILFTFPDGLTMSGHGGLQKLSVARVVDSKHMTADATFLINGGWTYGTTTTSTINGTLLTMGSTRVTFVSTAGSINLQAVGSPPINLNGEKLASITLTTPSGNSGNVTVAKGASNGYSFGSGVTFSQVLPPGATVTFYGTAAAVAVSDSNHLFDVTRTGTDAVSYFITIQ